MRRIQKVLTDAEDYHQQYLSDERNPNGYCGLGGTGVEITDAGDDVWGTCPTGITPVDGSAATRASASI